MRGYRRGDDAICIELGFGEGNLGGSWIVPTPPFPLRQTLQIFPKTSIHIYSTLKETQTHAPICQALGFLHLDHASNIAFNLRPHSFPPPFFSNFNLYSISEIYFQVHPPQS